MAYLGLVITLLIAVTGVTIVSSVRDFNGLPPGPYCGSRTRGCCPGRQDDCSAPIIGTLCYCDDFCNRTRNEDCCPDFWSYCKGVPDPPEEIFSCIHNNLYIPVNGVVKDNCRTCKCEVIMKNGKKVVEMLCDNEECLIDPEVNSKINDEQANLGWWTHNYTHFWGRTLVEGIDLRLGTLQPDRFVRHMVPVRKIYDPTALARHFDAEEAWPNKLSKIQDQGWCASSWAISTAAVASDRFGIMSKGMETVQLSAQHLLSCNNRGQQSCHGGYLDKAWMFFRRWGIVPENCYPYKGHNGGCHLPKKTDLRKAKCPPSDNDRVATYKVGPAYRLGNETDIMYEIMKSGPVQATLKVYQDFFVYRGGIYKSSNITKDRRTGYHSVRITGWGEEDGPTGVRKYWKVANSWGLHWGEKGYFRIARGTNECEIENFVLAVWADIDMDNNI